MSSGLDITAAASLARLQPVAAPKAAANYAAASKAAKSFESVFIGEFLGQMFADIPTDGPFGGGPGEEMFRSLMTDQYAQQIEKNGGFGLAAPVTQQLLKYQEMRG